VNDSGSDGYELKALMNLKKQTIYLLNKKLLFQIHNQSKKLLLQNHNQREGRKENVKLLDSLQIKI
jgi:hypothetical protein